MALNISYINKIMNNFPFHRKKLRKVKNSKMSNLPEVEPIAISLSDDSEDFWLHPNLDKFISLYHDESTGKGPWVEVTLQDLNDVYLDIIFRFYSSEEYDNFIKKLKKAEYDPEEDILLIGETNREINDMIAHTIISLFYNNLFNEEWNPEIEDDGPFFETEFMQDLSSKFNFFDDVICLRVKPNLTIKFDNED